MGGLIATLQYIINQSPSHSEVDVVIARYLLTHLYQENLSINDIADGCHISKASVTRFAQGLGYDGFNELKKSYSLTFIEQDEMKIDLMATEKMESTTQSLRESFDAVITDLDHFNQSIDFQSFDELCDLIHGAENIHIYATLIPGTLAEILQHMLLTAGKFVEYYPQLPNQLEASKKLGDGNLALFISLEGSYVMQKDLTLTITRSGATSVLVTQNPEMKLASVFDQVFSLGAHGTQRSGKYKLLMFVEYLAHRYFKKYI